MSKPEAAEDIHGAVSFAVVRPADLPLLEQRVRAYYAEDRHSFDEHRQPAALAALAAGAPFGRAWLIELV